LSRGPLAHAYYVTVAMLGHVCRLHFRPKRTGRCSKQTPYLDTKNCKCKKIKGVAERVGFEPTVGFLLHTLSKRAP
jgi:hypothetical protein